MKWWTITTLLLTQFLSIESVPATSRTHLSIYFHTSGLESSFYETVENALRDKVAYLLEVPSSSVIMHPLKYAMSIASYNFEIVQSSGVVASSYETPETFESWKNIWCERVKTLKSIEFIIQDGIKRAAIIEDKCTTQSYSFDFDENAYRAEDLYKVRSQCPEEIERFIEIDSKNTLMMRHKEKTIEFSKSYTPYDKVLSGLMLAVSDVVGVPQSSIYLKRVVDDTNALIFKFVIYTTSPVEEDRYKNSWLLAIQNQDPRILAALPYVDFTYPALENLAIVTPTPPALSTSASTMTSYEIVLASSNNGMSTTLKIIIGSVLGPLAGIAIIGVGAYMLRQKFAKDNKNPPSPYDDESDSDTPRNA